MTQYGQQVIYLSDLVKKFSLRQGNTKRVHFLRNMEFASWAWKELFRKSIWEIKTVVIPVDHKTHTIIVPEDCERLVNISVVDRFNQLQPLSYNPNMSTVDVLCEKGSCSCNHCHGANTLCEAMDNITSTLEDITINGQVYQQTTWVRSDGCGALQRETRTPVLDTATEEVVYINNTELICTVEVNEKGCILPTAPNIAALQTYCGYNGAAINNGCGYGGRAAGYPYRSLIPTPYNYYGHWNWNAASRDIIEIFRSRRNNCTYINSQSQCAQDCVGEENDIRKVILSYQTIGAVAGQEIIIPEYAEMAVYAGMLYQQAFFNPKDGDRNGTMLAAFRREKRNVDRHLNPIRMDDIIKLQTQPHRW